MSGKGNSTGDIKNNSGPVSVGDNINLIIDSSAMQLMQNEGKLKKIEKEIENNEGNNINIKCFNCALITKVIDIVDDIIAEIYNYYRGKTLEYVRVISIENFSY